VCSAAPTAGLLAAASRQCPQGAPAAEARQAPRSTGGARSTAYCVCLHHGRHGGLPVRALIVEQGWSRGALAAVRALAQAGWTVGVAAPDTRGLARWSRQRARAHLVRPLQPSVDAFIDSVTDAVRSGGYDVVFGAGEAELLALSGRRDALGAVFPHSAHEAVLRAVDKAELVRAAEAVGIAVPEEVEAEALPDESTPVVVKARLHARPDLPGAPPRIDSTVVVGRTAVVRRVAEIRALGGDPQVQAFATGALTAYAAVRGPQGVVADSWQRAARIWPPGAGASCRAVTIEADADLTARAEALLEHLDWFGLAELQFLVGEDGVPRLIDLNGRFYGSLSLAVAAGANLPAAWADLALGRAPTSGRVRARPGVHYHWGTADLRRAVRERRGGLLPDLASTAAYAMRARHSVLDPADPGPAVARLLGSRTTVSARTQARPFGGLVSPLPVRPRMAEEAPAEATAGR
jgi:predicted ATP-grasp superfamily ATP-dependent carboligase